MMNPIVIQVSEEEEKEVTIHHKRERQPELGGGSLLLWGKDLGLLYHPSHSQMSLKEVEMGFSIQSPRKCYREEPHSSKTGVCLNTVSPKAALVRCGPGCFAS